LPNPKLTSLRGRESFSETPSFPRKRESKMRVIVGASLLAMTGGCESRASSLLHLEKTNMLVKDRVAIVTGSGGGIGKGIVQRLAAHGAKTVVVDMNAELADRTAGEIRAAGGAASAYAGNVTSKAEVGQMTESVIARHGKVDILVNNVGIVRDNYLAKMPEEDWDLVLDTNLKSYFLCAQAATPHMREREYGRIVNISSRAWLGNVGQANYSAAKGGVVSLTRVLALELGRFNITANCIAPGLIDTPLYRGLREDVQERLRKAQPSNKVGTPEEIAYAAHFFASDEAWYVTGQLLYVCGGKSLGSFSV
jgi:NAD(P)-dependent dehydrogenase (short-subunit alcohol dehydrogenase family)